MDVVDFAGAERRLMKGQKERREEAAARRRAEAQVCEIVCVGVLQ